MRRLPLLALAVFLPAPAPAAAVSGHDWIDEVEAPFRIESVEVRFHPLAEAGAAAGLAPALTETIAATLAEWNAGGRPLRATITVEGVKWANAGVALVGGTADELAGLVELQDPATGAAAGRLYIGVWHSHGGLLGMALRGDAKAKLTRDFAEELARAATGRKRP